MKASRNIVLNQFIFYIVSALLHCYSLYIFNRLDHLIWSDVYQQNFCSPVFLSAFYLVSAISGAGEDHGIGESPGFHFRALAEALAWLKKIARIDVLLLKADVVSVFFCGGTCFSFFTWRIIWPRLRTTNQWVYSVTFAITWRAAVWRLWRVLRSTVGK